MRIKWCLKPSKKDQSGEKTFLVDPNRSAISAVLAINTILHTRVIGEEWPLMKTPLFWDPETKKGMFIWCYMSLHARIEETTGDGRSGGS